MKELGGTFAQYHGRLYKAHPTTDQDVVLLLAPGDSAPEPGFESKRPGIWRKHVPVAELDEYYEVDHPCRYRGLDCTAVWQDEAGELEIQYLAGNSYAARDAGMTEVDHGVWQKRVPRHELDEIHEQRKDLLAAR